MILASNDLRVAASRANPPVGRGVLSSLEDEMVDVFHEVVGRAAPPPAPMPGPTVPLHPHGHSHNDEMQAHPLVDSLNAGFTSIEVDTHLINGKLLVGHSHDDALHIGKTLEQSYFAPLAERVKQYGAVYQGGPPVTLLLDFKGERNASGEQIYQALQPLLEKYPDMLSRYESGKVIEGPLHLVISGTEPKLDLQSDRSVFLDGRVADLLTNPQSISPATTPMVSGNYKEFIHWNGSGTMSAGDQKRLHTIVDAAHQRGAGLRLWDAPDNSNTWQALEKAGVDYINTDNLTGFANWQDLNPGR